MRAFGSVLSPSPNNRSNTVRGLISAGSGLVGPRHDIDMYAHVYPESQFPASGCGSNPSSNDESCVFLPSSFAAIWSAEIARRKSAPPVLYGWTPVRNVAVARAWSPGPSPSARPFTCASPPNTLTYSRNGSSGFIVGLNSKFAPAVFGVHMNGRGLLSHAPTMPFGV